MQSPDNLFSMGVYTREELAREYPYKDEVFIVGHTGDAYEITLLNSSRRRTLAVVTVDGLCAIDGQELVEGGLGYILEPQSFLRISTWRFETNQCPPFQFRKLPVEFISVMDRPSNIGTIEASFFFEQSDPFYVSNYLAQSGYAFIQAATAGWVGGRFSERVMRQQFAREALAFTTLVLQYEERSVLCSMGITTLPET